MLKEDISYKDFNGADRKVSLYFHLNKKEIIDLMVSTPDGLQVDMEKAILSNDVKQLLDFITNLVHLSYGQRSNDGVYFHKSPEILRGFVDAVYYDEFIMSLLDNNGAKAQTFLNGIFPADLVAQAEAQLRGGQVAPQNTEVDRTQEFAPSAREQFAAAQEQARAAQLTGNNFGQPEAPQPVQTPTAPEHDAKYQEYLAWKAQQNAASAPASPDAFRVPAEAPVDHIGRPPHEQFG